ncbi:MAG: zf-HC2 domain-containing protein [Ktedonobacteraceae bacterium]
MKESQQMDDNCLDTGLLVSLRDGELTADEKAQSMAHLAICPDCAADERHVNKQSREVYDLLSILGPHSSEVPEPAVALSAMQARLDPARQDENSYEVIPLSAPVRRGRLFRLSRRQRGWLTAAIAAALVVLLILPNASVLAEQFLALFRVQQFQPVTVNPQSLGRELVSELQNFSDVKVSSYSDNQSNLTQAQVQKLIHFPLLLPSRLPSGVGHAIQFNLIGGGQVIFTFDAAKARAYLAKTGQSSVNIPTQLDGAKFNVTVNSGVMVNYFNSCQAVSTNSEKTPGQCSGGKTFSVLEIPGPVVQALGNASLKDLRDFLLSLPKQSSQMRDLLQHIDLNTGTVPLPIPSEVNAQQVTTHGASGILLADSSTRLALVLWQMHGIIYVVGAATSDSAQLLDAANSLR